MMEYSGTQYDLCYAYAGTTWGFPMAQYIMSMFERRVPQAQVWIYPKAGLWAIRVLLVHEQW